MDSKLEKYYNDRFSMMSQQGWKDLMEDVEGMFEEYNKVTGVGQTTLDFRKGQLDILSWLLGLKDISELTYKDALEEEE